MRRILLILVGATVVLAGAWWVASLPGHVSAEIGTISIRTPTAVFLLGALAVFVVLYALTRALGSVLRLPSTIGRWRSQRHRRLGDIAIAQALIALAAGEKGDARREASKARAFLGDTAQTLLLVAEAGRLADREDEAEAAFRSLVATPDAAFLGYRGLLRQAIARADWPEAAALARLAEEAHPGAEWVRHERSQLAVRAHRWAEALDLAGVTAPRAALGVGAAAAESDPAKAKRRARQAWEDDKSLTPAALAHAGHLRAEGKEARALTVIGETWALMPHPALAAFALAPVEDKLAQVQAAKRLIAKIPDHAESQFLLARISLAAGLTGEARAHAKRAHEGGLNQRRLWLLLAEVEEEERGDTEAGRLALRDALRHAATAEANPAWQCEVCHATHAVWEPACLSCATPGALRWGSAASFKPTLAAIG